MKFVARGQVCFNSICFVFFVSRLGLVWGRVRSCLWGRVAGIGGRWSGFYAYKFLHWIGPGLFPCGCGWGGVGCGGVGVGLCGVRSRELGAGCAPHLPRFILLVSFSDTLLVVAILGIVYDCRLRPLLQF